MPAISQGINTILALCFAVVPFVALAGDGSSIPLSLAGTTVVKAVDDRRVLVAVDSGNEGHADDGLIDHVFMFTGKAPFAFADHEGSGPAHLEFDGNSLVVTWKDRFEALQFVVHSEVLPAVPRRPGTVYFDDAVGLSHYSGFSGFKLLDLDHVRRSERCDHVAGSCYEANGHLLQFPA